MPNNLVTENNRQSNGFDEDSIEDRSRPVTQIGKYKIAPVRSAASFKEIIGRRNNNTHWSASVTKQATDLSGGRYRIRRGNRAGSKVS